MSDPKAVVRRGYDLVSRAYRADDAEEGAYAEWLDFLRHALALAPSFSISVAAVEFR